MSERSWLRRPSVLSRQALVLYTALIVYGSWYPFSGWRSLGLGPLAYLSDPMPQYLTAFDVVTNVLGYMPFGALMVLALYPRWRGPLAVALAFVLGGLLSGVMEAVQTYLPTRVASTSISRPTRSARCSARRSCRPPPARCLTAACCGACGSCGSSATARRSRVS